MKPTKVTDQSTLLSPRASLDIFASMLLDHKPSTRSHCETILFQRLVTVSLLDFLCLTSSKPARKPLFQQYDLYNFLALSWYSFPYAICFFFPTSFTFQQQFSAVFGSMDIVYITFPFRSTCICWNQCHFFLLKLTLLVSSRNLKIISYLTIHSILRFHWTTNPCVITFCHFILVKFKVRL